MTYLVNPWTALYLGYNGNYQKFLEVDNNGMPQVDDDFLNGNLSFQWDASDTTMLYAGYGVGSKTGGFAESAEVGSGDPSLDVADNGAQLRRVT